MERLYGRTPRLFDGATGQGARTSVLHSARTSVLQSARASVLQSARTSVLQRAPYLLGNEQHDMWPEQPCMHRLDTKARPEHVIGQQNIVKSLMPSEGILGYPRAFTTGVNVRMLLPKQYRGVGRFFYECPMVFSWYK